MAFVIEELKENDLEYVKSFGFKHPLSIRDDAILPDTWVADHESNCYLICLGAGGWRSYETDEFPPSYYKLIVNDKVVDIEARFRWEGNYKTKIREWWKIINIVVLENVDMTSERLKEIVKKCFEVESNNQHHNYVIEVNFDLIVDPIFVKGGNK